MDQIKAALGWLNNQHFWVLSVLAVALAIGCWYKAASALSKEYEASRSTIETAFTNQQTLQRKEFHPNVDINDEQEKQTIAQKAQVKQLWEQLYDVQRESVLTWPSVLGPDFQQRIEPLEFGDDIPTTLRRFYLDYAKGHFPELPKIVDALVMDPGRGRNMLGGSGRGGLDLSRVDDMLSQMRSQQRTGDGEQEPSTPEDFLVIWADQEKVREQLAFAESPSSLRIWVTQENLWVYTTLLQVVANTNKAAGATRFSNAAIRVIESLDVGQVAAQMGRGKGRIMMRQETTGRGLENGEMQGMEMIGERGLESGFGNELNPYSGMADGGYMMSSGDGRSPYGAGAPGEGGEIAELVSHRYIDSDGKPIPVSGEFNSAELGQAYKQLPIRMELKMDQRWLYYLIAQCASAPLQVEVQEVRVNPIGGNSGYGGRGSDMSFGLRSSRMGGSSGAYLGGTGRQQVEVFDRQPNLVPVVIQGSIFIFSKPNPDVLLTDEPSV